MWLMLMINNCVVIGDAKQVLPGSLTRASCCLCDRKAPSTAWECNYVQRCSWQKVRQCPNVFRVLALLLFSMRFLALDTGFAKRGIASIRSASLCKGVTLLWFRLSLADTWAELLNPFCCCSAAKTRRHTQVLQLPAGQGAAAGGSGTACAPVPAVAGPRGACGGVGV